jgi:lactam utilization protein B
MAEEKKEPWLNFLALTTVILAVCATMATFKGGGFSTRQMLNQVKASDQWAFYQAKSMKGNLYETGLAQLELQQTALPAGTPKPVAEAYAKRIADFKGKITKYDQEKAEITKEAKAFEQARDDAQKHGALFGLAVIFLQIAILLSSIAALLKKRLVWLLGLAVGAVGVLYFANGFFLFF